VGLTGQRLGLHLVVFPVPGAHRLQQPVLLGVGLELLAIDLVAREEQHDQARGEHEFADDTNRPAYDVARAGGPTLPATPTAPPPKSDAEKQAEAEKAAAKKAKEAADLAKAQDKAVANYKKNMASAKK
jgi:hypothetical protein